MEPCRVFPLFLFRKSSREANPGWSGRQIPGFKLCHGIFCSLHGHSPLGTVPGWVWLQYPDRIRGLARKNWPWGAAATEQKSAAPGIFGRRTALAPCRLDREWFPSWNEPAFRDLQTKNLSNARGFFQGILTPAQDFGCRKNVWMTPRIFQSCSQSLEGRSCGKPGCSRLRGIQNFVGTRSH